MSDKHFLKLSSILKFFEDEQKLVTRGENAVESGHVFDMMFDEQLKFIRGHVHASMKDKKYTVRIYLNPDWTINKADCTCPRGQFICHHMASLALFGHYNLSVTDKSCSWNVSKAVQSEEVKKITDIYPSTKNHATTSRSLSNEEITEFKNKLQMYDGAVGFTWLLSDEKNISDNLIVDIEDILFNTNYSNNKNKINYFEEQVKVTQEIIMKVVTETVGQAKNATWLIARKNRLTASNFYPVISACRRNRYPPSLFKRLSGTYDIEHLKAVQWGREHEIEGINALEIAKNIEVLRTGLWLHEWGYIGASPDGIVGEDAIVEVKCPYKYRDTSIINGIKDKNYIVISDDDGNITVNKNHEYFYQIQGQLAITKRKLCYLVIWSPRETIITEVAAGDFSQEINLIRNFYLNHYIKFITGEKYIV